MGLNDDLKKALKGALYDSVEDTWCSGFLPTGIVAVDRALGGGFGEGRIHEVFGGWSTGKGQPPDARVCVPGGWAAIGELQPGDHVIGIDGESHPVTGVFPKAPIQTYRVTFSDGTSLVVDKDHLWQVMTPSDRRKGTFRVISTKELADAELFYGKRKNRKWSIPLTKPVEFGRRQTKIDPYLLGVLLGDGCLAKTTPSFTNPDKWFASYLPTKLPRGVGMNRVSSSGRCPTWSFPGSGGQNNLTKALEHYLLQGCLSHQKHVPEEFLYNSSDVRVAVLQGLMDTDGESCGAFSTSSEELAQDVVFIVQSLGGTATISVRPKPVYTYKGERRIGRPSYRVWISVPNEVCIFRSPARLANWTPRKKGCGRWIVSVEKESVQPTVCISVDSPMNLYVTEHFIVTHNTVLLYAWLIHNQLNGGKSFLFEAEGAFSPEWYEAQGGIFEEGNPKSLLLVPDLQTVEDFFTKVRAIIKTIKTSGFKGPVAIGWDGIAATGTKHLVKEGLEGSRDMTKAFVMDQGTKMLIALLHETRIAVVATNQTRSKIGARPWEPTHTPGGKAWPFGSSCRVELELDGGPKGSMILDGEGRAIGRYVRGNVVKNKQGPPFRDFKLPIYTEGGVKHPTFHDAVTMPGVDRQEALLDYYHMNKRATFGPGLRYIDVKGSRLEVNESLFGMKVKSFFRKDWLKVLDAFPQLNSIRPEGDA